MLKLIRVSLILVIAGAAVAFAQTANVDSLGWMAGCWEMNLPQRQMSIAEQWMKPAGGSMVGMGRTVRNGKMTMFEHLRIVTNDAGTEYVAKPSTNKEETAFKLVKSSGNEVVFENLAHDFPQRIIYRQPSSDELFARIEGTQNGKLNGMDIPMKRVKCE